MSTTPLDLTPEERELAPAAVPPTTRDLGLLIRDMIEDRDFEVFDADRDNETVGLDCVTSVDASDPNNLEVLVGSGRRFTIRIIATG